jgi:hypothetical protein
MSREFQCAAILGNGSDDIFRCPRLNLSLDFEGDFDGRSHQPGKMGDHLVGDPARIAPYTSRIKIDTTVKPLWLRWLFCWRRWWRRFVARSVLGTWICYLLGMLLLQRDLRTNQKTGQVVLRNIHQFAATQTAIAACYVIETVGIGERVLAPGKQTQPLANGVEDDG